MNILRDEALTEFFKRRDDIPESSQCGLCFCTGFDAATLVLPERLLQGYPDALKEFKSLSGVFDYWFDMAFGVTPALFVMHDKDDDPKLTRIRLKNPEREFNASL